MKLRKGTVLITLLCVLLGFSIVGAFQDHYPDNELVSIASIREIEQLLSEKKGLEEQRQTLLEKVREHEAVIEKYEKEITEKSLVGQEVRDSLRNSRLLAGLTDLKGPGVEIVLNDRKRDSIITQNPNILGYYIVHDSDLLDVVNELRAAGAEAIAINGERILANSRISCGGPTINVGKEQRFTPPFIIQAIGDPDELAAYFQRPDSIYQSLIYWGLEFSIKKKELIEIPRYFGEIKFEHAKAKKEGE